MRYRVRLFDAQLRTIREQSMEADSPDDLRAELQRAGNKLLTAAPWRQGKPDSLTRARDALDVAWWCRELRTLLSAGMTVVEAMDTLHVQSSDAGRAEVQASLLMQLQQGQALSAAMRVAGVFPAVLVASIAASERTSSMLDALDDFLRYHEMLERLRKQVLSAAIYPAVVLSLGLVICVFLLLFVLPRFASMYTDMRGSVGWATTALIHLSRMVKEHQVGLLAGLAAVVALLVLAWRGGHVQAALQAMLLHIEPLQRRIDEFRLAKLYHSLAVMFRGGYALDDALGQCEQLGLGGRLDEGVRSARQALLRGAKVSSAMADAGLANKVTRRLLAVGERTGNFERVLQTIADRHAGNFSTFMERATRIVEPLLLLCVALLVGGIVVMMYMPVFDIASSVR